LSSVVYFCDRNGRLYVYFTIDDVWEIFKIGATKAKRLFKELISINGSDCTANIIDNVDKFHIISGRKPSNPNEIVITKTISESLSIGTGDNVTVDSKGNSAVFHISGIYQCANEMGANIGMSEQGYQRLADTDGYIWYYRRYQSACCSGRSHTYSHAG
jgi:hypothetical protein